MSVLPDPLIWELVKGHHSQLHKGPRAASNHSRARRTAAFSSERACSNSFRNFLVVSFSSARASW